MFTHQKKKILKMDLIHQNNINELDLNKSHYFWMECYQNQKKTMEQYDYNDWTTEIDHDKLIPDNYSFKVRMMGFDPDDQYIGSITPLDKIEPGRKPVSEMNRPWEINQYKMQT